MLRERLLNALDTSLQCRLTLLSAAAGWGKTTLLSVWASRYPHAVTWVSLDARDNHQTLFWTTLITAIQVRIPTAGSLALAMLQGSEPAPLSAFLAVLLDDLAAAALVSPIVIVLDDYHAIDDPLLLEGMTLLVEQLPLQVHLVIATRVDPDLPLPRWRVRNLVAELRATDLRFTDTEAHALLGRALDDDLTADVARRLAQRTEGWVAGLQLAALMIRQRADRAAFVESFAGSHRFLLDYVHDEVLAHQPPHIQRFLLYTAILRQMNAALCTALTGDPDSQATLEWLERHNLFVVPLDDARRWYRAHDLFREVLLARLHVTEPATISRLHQRAAQWFAEQGELREAIAHAFDARDHEYAGELVERAAPELWLRGEAQTVHRWLHSLPDSLFQRHARLALDAVLRLPEAIRPTDTAAFSSVQIQVEQTLARVEARLRAGQCAPLSAAEVAVLHRRVRLLRAWIEMRARVQQADVAGLRLLAEEASGLAEQEDVSWKVLALSFTFWLAYTFRQAEPRLIPRLLAVKEQAVRLGDHGATLRAVVFLAHMYLAAGCLYQLEQECREGIQRARQLGVQTAALGNLQLTLAESYYAWNRLDAAADALRTGLQIAETWEHRDMYLWGSTLLARLELARHDTAAADRALHQAEAVVRQERFLHWAPTVAATRAQFWLATGNRTRADAWLGQSELDSHRMASNQNIVVLTQVQVLMAQRQPLNALELLERFAGQLDQPGHIPTTTEFLALYLVAAHQVGRHEQMRGVALRLFALTEPEDNLRIYLDRGAPMRRALLSLQEAPATDEAMAPRFIGLIARLLAAFAPEAQDERPLPAPPPSPERLPAPPSPYSEPLTQREREVLRLLVAGASNQEIARQLVISLATAKKHVSNILGKLGVASRAQAVAAAHGWLKRP